MASTHESIEYGDDVKGVLNTVVILGTITAINGANDTADVLTSEYGLLQNVPIFFHCEGSTTTEGGASAFEKDDEVIMVAKGAAGLVVTPSFKIVAHSDTKKKCIGEIIEIRTYDFDSHEYYGFLWDVKKGGYATNVTDGSGNPVTFPCRTSLYSDWLTNNKTRFTSVNIYSTTYSIMDDHPSSTRFLYQTESEVPDKYPDDVSDESGIPRANRMIDGVDLFSSNRCTITTDNPPLFAGMNYSWSAVKGWAGDDPTGRFKINCVMNLSGYDSRGLCLKDTGDTYHTITTVNVPITGCSCASSPYTDPDLMLQGSYADSKYIDRTVSWPSCNGSFAATPTVGVNKDKKNAYLLSADLTITLDEVISGSRYGDETTQWQCCDPSTGCDSSSPQFARNATPARRNKIVVEQTGDLELDVSFDETFTLQIDYPAEDIVVPVSGAISVDPGTTKNICGTDVTAVPVDSGGNPIYPVKTGTLYLFYPSEPRTMEIQYYYNAGQVSIYAGGGKLLIFPTFPTAMPKGL